MTVQRFEITTEIPRPAAEVFRWHERPGALERLTPPWEHLDVISEDGSLQDGKRVRLRQRVAGITADWEVEHRGYVEGKQFRDVALKSPFKHWEHVHRFVAESAGSSRLIDQISYALPGGALGSLLGSGWTERRLKRLFTFRQTRLREDLRAAAIYGAVRPMRFLISGASGTVGRTLIPFLRTQGHEVVRLVRRTAQGLDEVSWDPENGRLDIHELRGIDVVVHLAGANIAEGRWSRARRDEIWKSRINSTHTLAVAMNQMKHRPFAFICASAIGFYGDGGATELDEQSGRGTGFVSDLCEAWEREAAAVEELAIRTVRLRAGVVLTPDGGALARLLPFFRSGLGGRLGSGSQWMSWISIDDMLGAIYHSVLDQRCSGPVNAVSPEPVTNAEFTATLARVLGRPTLLNVPAPVLRARFGDMANETLLSSARVIPGRLREAKYLFRHERLEDALRFLLGRVE